MEPQVRYCKTSDGVNIAYWAIGRGPPLVIIELPASNVQFEWIQPETRATYEAIARNVTLVRYDHRGFGLSDKWQDEFTTDAFVRDLEAVVDRLELERFFVLASRGFTYPIALEYARLHPERLLRLAAIIGGPSAEFMPAIVETPGVDWRFITEAVVRRIAGWENEEVSANYAEYLRQSTDLAGLRRLVRWFAVVDTSADLQNVTAPCLLLPSADAVDEARALASRMPDAVVQLQPVLGKARENQAAITHALTAFFTQGREASAQAVRSQQPAERAAADTAILLFADVVESTAITARIGNAAFRERTRQLDDALRGAIRDAGGSPVEGRTLGDGVLGVFTSAAQAIAAALQCEQHAEGVGLQLHLGIHAGDVIRESGGGVSGLAVSLASRISDLTGPNEILVSGTVRDLARASTGVTFEDRGEYQLKGIAEAVRVYAVRAEGG